jgi:GNAT superfamily N-acetyltransferase
MNSDPTQIANLRIATRDDVSRLVELNHAAYPDLVEAGVVWEASQLHVHQDHFATGQIVAESNGVVAGAIATFVVPKTVDALAPHTWLGITDGGFFTSHDPNGATLYLADIYVDPVFWGRGIGKALYGALRDLCRRLNLSRVVAGGRLWGYADVSHQMSAEAYVARVIAGGMRDRVLDSQLRAGYVVRGLLPNYLQDERSRNWATLLEWENGLTTRNDRRAGLIDSRDPGVRAATAAE